MGTFKILAKFNTVIEAEIVQLLLESEGIRSDVLDSNLSYTIGPTFSQGIRLQVRAEDYELAVKVYENSLDNSSNDFV
ncbi:putative signal transducing protein [Faecalibacter rhinopitheci]|uniref:DUF2007 domain-containing protein n=1 Tax=Faecalibacter rhinopitheci TaxID=2779678 RepID=A0A8J7FNR2_9FLAO|nr:DUF2007 domain-containing protein [Faecalibacter rhinopitheci]MBF0596454.1 DUF2007 domain-containing protein [Faecalibacter rhinopitheci]MBQ0148958.1 DUF2007 domain-containing protein [Candidatus Onthonaster equi]